MQCLKINITTFIAILYFLSSLFADYVDYEFNNYKITIMKKHNKRSNISNIIAEKKKTQYEVFYTAFMLLSFYPVYKFTQSLTLICSLHLANKAKSALEICDRLEISF